MCYDDLMTSMQLELNGARMQRNMQLFAHTLASFVVKILMKAKKNTFRVLHFVTYKCLCMKKKSATLFSTYGLIVKFILECLVLR